MKRQGPVIALVVVLLAFVVGLTVLFRLRLAQGDVFPAYSSLRSDPLGTRALHDSLARLPGLHVERSFRSLNDLERGSPRTLIVAGVQAKSWAHTTREEFDALDAAVRAGSRLVVALRAEASATQEEKEEVKKSEEKARKKRKTAGDEEPRVDYVDLARRWGVDLRDRILVDRVAGASRTDEPSAHGLPAQVPWQSELFFQLEPDSDWRVIYRRGREPVVVERTLGQGSLVLIADSYFLSNEALQKDRAPALLAWTIGSHRHVIFDEAHLGVVAEPGVAALARRYGLSGAFATLLVLALLFVWRRTALFVPAVEEKNDVALAYHPAAGLEALLRRSVPVTELAAACVTEWKPTARETDRARVATAMAAQPAGASAVARYNALVAAIRKRSRSAPAVGDSRVAPPDFSLMNPALEKLNATLSAARTEIAKVVIGQESAIELALLTLLTRNHALIEGVPGVAKTLLVRTLGHVLGVPSGRVQFTPDLMPADITGTNVFNLQTNAFTLIKGPVFTAFLLADEINRAPAKTQAALLQAMQERVVTIDRDTHVLDDSFTVFATQNPADSEGTYPLPEAQKDRFMMKIKMDPPSRDEELLLAKRMLGAVPPEAVLASGAVKPVLAPGELAAARGALGEVTMRDELGAYVVDLVRATRAHESVLVGAGPRATQALLLGGRARAALDGRDYVTPDDVRGLANGVLGHRIVLRPEFEIEGLTIEEVVARVLEQVAVPR